MLRCSGSATFSYLLGASLGLPRPVWASVSSVIVSQGSIFETRASVGGRIVGTICGVSVAVLVHLAVAPIIVGPVPSIALAVAICAAVAFRFSSLRVCMWTSLIVLLTGTANETIYWVAFYRGSEVILGSIVGAACHFLTIVVRRAIRRGRMVRRK